MSGEEVIGVFQVANKDHDYTERDVLRLGRIAEVVGPVLKARLGREREFKARLEMTRRMEHAQKLESLGVLAGGIAHDFNNILVGILGLADLTLMELPEYAPARDDIVEIKKAATRAAELTNQMLAYSGKGRFVVEAVDMNHLIRDMDHLLQVSVAKSTVLRLDLGEPLFAIEADATQIRQVVMNLITNAGEAIGERSGVITLATGVVDADRAYLRDSFSPVDRPPGTYVFLEVSDTGSGMDRETMARIFDPFFTTKFTGRGLGLAALQGIVHGHDGAIRVYSEVGKGTTFKILFPAEESAAAVEAESRATEGGTKLSGTVLVADDEETVRGVTKRILTRRGLDVLLAADGKEAVEMYREHMHRIDLVLLDMTMPRLSGSQVFTELRRMVPDARVILISGYNEQDAISRFAGKGLAGFVQKPFDVATLVAAIRRELPGHGAQGE